MGKMQRTKGHNWERDVANFLTKLGLDSNRKLEYQKDVKGDVLIRPLQNIYVQCKNMIQPSLWGAYRQSLKDSDSKFILLPLKRSGSSVKKEDKAIIYCMTEQLFEKVISYAINGGIEDDTELGGRV